MESQWTVINSVMYKSCWKSKIIQDEKREKQGLCKGERVNGKILGFHVMF